MSYASEHVSFDMRTNVTVTQHRNEPFPDNFSISVGNASYSLRQVAQILDDHARLGRRGETLADLHAELHTQRRRIIELESALAQQAPDDHERSPQCAHTSAVKLMGQAFLEVAAFNDQRAQDRLTERIVRVLVDHGTDATQLRERLQRHA